MGLHVPSQIAGLRERHVACLAVEGFLTRVDPHVQSPAAGVGERLSAHLAVEGFLSRVGLHVHSQVAIIRKRPPHTEVSRS